MVTDAQALEFLTTLLICAGFAFVAYGMRVLDVAGSILAFALALVIVTSEGGIRWLILLIGFVAFGFIVTKMFWARKTAMGVAEGKKGVRGWRNVAANGLVPGIMALLTFFVPREEVLLGFVTAIAVASSDTFASELGVLSHRTYLITAPWKRVPPGMNGGVSNWGHFVALIGAAVPSLVAVPLVGLAWDQVWIPILGGWIGCQVDSVIGALFEEERGRAYGLLTKSDVNFLSIALVAFAVLLITVGT